VDAQIAIEPLRQMLVRESGLPAARVVEALAFIAPVNELNDDPDHDRALETILSGADQYNIMMASRAEVRLGRPAARMPAAGTHLLRSRSNWQVWEAVDALAELEPTPGWARTLLLKASRHPNGLVRARAQAALNR
jgi:hypothetical protein